MGRRVTRLLVTILTLGLALGPVPMGERAAAGATMCPPVTIADVIGGEENPTEEPSDTVPDPEEPPCDTAFVYPMTFPVLGGGVIGSPFGAARDGGSRLHLGVDVSAPKLQPVAAVAEGTVEGIVVGSERAGTYVRIIHDDGWSSVYVHLNDDTAGTNDGFGVGVRPDLEVGTRVEAGEVIGWVGDSGNAEGGEPHLHFELHDPTGVPVDAEPSLRAATRIGPTFVGPFADLEDPDHLLVWLLSRGVPTWCEEPYLACPDRPADSSGLAPWFDALLLRSDALDGTLQAGVTEADLARGIVWSRLWNAYQLQAWWIANWIPDPDWNRFDPPPPGSPFEVPLTEAYSRLRGVERCLPIPDDGSPLIRAEAATVLALYLGWSSVDLCPANAANL